MARALESLEPYGLDTNELPPGLVILVGEWGHIAFYDTLNHVRIQPSGCTFNGACDFADVVRVRDDLLAVSRLDQFTFSSPSSRPRFPSVRLLRVRFGQPRTGLVSRSLLEAQRYLPFHLEDVGGLTARFGRFAHRMCVIPLDEPGPRGALCTTGEGFVRIFDVEKKKMIHAMNDGDDAPRCVRFAHERVRYTDLAYFEGEKKLFASGKDRHLRRFDLTKGHITASRRNASIAPRSRLCGVSSDEASSSPLPEGFFTRPDEETWSSDLLLSFWRTRDFSSHSSPSFVIKDLFHACRGNQFFYDAPRRLLFLPNWVDPTRCWNGVIEAYDLRMLRKIGSKKDDERPEPCLRFDKVIRKMDYRNRYISRRLPGFVKLSVGDDGSFRPRDVSYLIVVSGDHAGEIVTFNLQGKVITRRRELMDTRAVSAMWDKPYESLRMRRELQQMSSEISERLLFLFHEGRMCPVRGVGFVVKCPLSLVAPL